jgi:Domain of unknown function (DUF4263)
VARHAIQESQQYLPVDAFAALRDAVLNTCTDQQLSTHAEQLLARVVRAYLVNPLGHTLLGDLLGIGELYFGYRIYGDDAKFEAVARLVARLIAKNTLAIDDESCAELQRLIESDLEERVYQQFLTLHPAMLDPLAASVAPLQVLGEKWKTDFVIRRLDDQYVFVEIEKPKDEIFSNYPHPTMALSHALGQVLNWFAWLEDHSAYARENGFPGIHAPLGLVVIGRDRDLSAQQSRILRTLNDTLYPRIAVRTFDEVLRGARLVLENMTNR